jgi:ribosomal protein S12 methylthiotransferase accessory factor
MKIYFAGNKKVNAETDGHEIKTDQPKRGGGSGAAPAPFDLFLASLGTCAGIYVKGFCDKRGIDSTDIYLEQDIRYDQKKRMIGEVAITIHVRPEFPEKYHGALANTAGQCAVKRHLHPGIKTTVNVSVDQNK